MQLHSPNTLIFFIPKEITNLSILQLYLHGNVPKVA